jgi:hypothetical protein
MAGFRMEALLDVSDTPLQYGLRMAWTVGGNNSLTVFGTFPIGICYVFSWRQLHHLPKELEDDVSARPPA